MATVTPGASRTLGPGTAVPPRMVSVQLSKDSASGVPRLSTGYKPTWEGQAYNPRAQRTAGREQWREDVAESVRKSGIPTSTLAEQPPSIQSIMSDNPKLDAKEVEAALNVALADYQVRNTALWDVVRPSLELSGAFEIDDREYIRDTFMNGDLRDGGGLYRLSLHVADVLEKRREIAFVLAQTREHLIQHTR